jgi:hypothetical protein
MLIEHLPGTQLVMLYIVCSAMKSLARKYTGA